MNIHLEIKSLQNRSTIGSFYVNLAIQANVLSLVTSWSVAGDSHLQPLRGNKMMGQLPVINSRYLDFYDYKFRFAKVNFGSYIAGKPAV